MNQSIEPLTNPASLDLKRLNQKFEQAHPKDILAWCVINIPTGLVQTSVFSVDDLLITDLLYRDLQPPNSVPVLFLDTLHHFPQTLDLVAKAKHLYRLNLKSYKIPGVTMRQDFAEKYGEALWEKDSNKFHQLTKVEPLQRGLAELGAIAWLTGNRRDQASTFANLPIFELDSQQRLKVNPLANWTRKETWAYVFEYDVTYNPLHDQGYSNIGDEPLTRLPTEVASK
ncbi:phosphoadenylyl-sulfate reductase [Phormidium sp. CLA17]|uniref:phosphoadenylyl-sulfate reductase n=1 Tax=Leptolyngbya sp. Cla-17 TaxID=2803751 RepID=UPI001491C45B|nr:phosphoadenylyl-sulfate reductase [Leptolyngbya sp. Cla-17]MBM0741337.1 phosphoadenylyl-sulfate reductase [Leptolyngbya sp. Cla-17]